MALDDRDLMAEWDRSYLPEAAVARELSVAARKVSPTWVFRQILHRERPNPSILRDIAADFEAFADKRTSTQDMHRQMRAGFAITRGRSNEVIGSLLKRHVAARDYDVSRSMFEPGEPARIEQEAVAALRENAYWKAPFLAPAPLVERLRTIVSGGLEDQHGDGFGACMRGDEGAPAQLKSSSAWLMAHEEMYLLASDPLLMSIVHSYLGVPPIYDVPVAFLNSTVQLASHADYSRLAQLYHHDMDRLSFVKLFVYLTDVDPGSGPHALLPGTHRRRPARFWRSGRFSDEELDRAGLLSSEVKITGPAGTVFLVDTSVLHKGAHPVSRPRLMAQVQYSNCLFGLRASAEDGKVRMSASSKDERILQAAELVRKYAATAGVRFMQRYI